MVQPVTAVVARSSMPATGENDAVSLPAGKNATSRATVGLDSGQQILLAAARDFSGTKLKALPNVKIAEEDRCSKYWTAAMAEHSECTPTMPALTNALRGFFVNVEKSNSRQLLMVSEHEQLILEKSGTGAIMFSNANLTSATAIKGEYALVDEVLTRDVIFALHGQAKFDALMQRIDRCAAADAQTQEMEAMSFSNDQEHAASNQIPTLVMFATPPVDAETRIFKQPLSEAEKTCATVFDGDAPAAQPAVQPAVQPVTAARLAAVPASTSFAATSSGNEIEENATNHRGQNRRDSIGSCDDLFEPSQPYKNVVALEKFDKRRTFNVDDNVSTIYSETTGASSEPSSVLTVGETHDGDSFQKPTDAREERTSLETRQCETLLFSLKKDGQLDPAWETTNFIDGMIENVASVLRNTNDLTQYTNLKTDKQNFFKSTNNNQKKLEAVREKLRDAPEHIRDEAGVAYDIERSGLELEISARELQLRMAAQVLEAENKCKIELDELYEEYMETDSELSQASLASRMLQAYEQQRELYRTASDRQDRIQESLRQDAEVASPAAAESDRRVSIVSVPANAQEMVNSAVDSTLDSTVNRTVVKTLDKTADETVVTRSRGITVHITDPARIARLSIAMKKIASLDRYGSIAEGESAMGTSKAQLEQELLDVVVPTIFENVETIFNSALAESERNTRNGNARSLRSSGQARPRSISLTSGDRAAATPFTEVLRQQSQDAGQGAHL